MPLLIVLFVAVAFLLAVLLLMEAGEVVSLPRGLSAVLLYLLYFSLFAVIATTLLEVISALSLGGVRPERRVGERGERDMVTSAHHFVAAPRYGPEKSYGPGSLSRERPRRTLWISSPCVPTS
jgi:hypothetical protein